MSTSWVPGRTISGYTFSKKDCDITRLKLAIVKRNFNYIAFYEALSKDTYSVISELQQPDEPREIHLKRLGEVYAQNGPFFGGRAVEFGFFERFIVIAQEYWGVATSEILELLHPRKDRDDFKPSLVKGLPLLFYSPGVEEFGLAHGMVVDEDKLCYRRYKPEISGDVERYERILKIDLRKNPAQLIQEFKTLLEYEREYLKAGKKYEPLMKQILKINATGNSNRLFDWNIDNARERKETWDQIKVWDLRGSSEIVRIKGSGTIVPIRRTFGRISNMLRITEDLARKRFYRAYETTQGRKYNIERNRELWMIRKSDLKRECGTCEIRDTCNDPCPDVLRFIDQDYVGPTADQPLPPEVENMSSDQESGIEPDLNLDKIKK